MANRKTPPALEKARVAIAQKVRQLRTERRWTQAELAHKLGLSQSRLCELEQGAGSFSAEQMLLLLQLFNVGVSAFAPSAERKPDAELQNALARLGAPQLHERPDVLPSERFEEVGEAVREALISAESPRYLTALAPVLVGNVDHLNLRKLERQFVAHGLERRLGWLVNNTLEALRRELREALPRPWARQYRRAEVVLGAFLDLFAHRPDVRLAAQEVACPDILDPDITSRETLDEVIATSSDLSRRWGIATSLKPEDFVEALRAARAGH